MSTEAIKLLEKFLTNNETYLDLGNCGLTDETIAEGTAIDKLLTKCTHLQTLILSNSWYQWDEDGKFRRKTSGNKGNKNFFTTAPPALRKLKELTKLIMSGERKGEWGISNMRFVQDLINLKILHLGYNKILKIEGLTKLTGLNQLYLYDNELTKIEGFEKLTQLTQLELSDNKLTKIEGLEKLTALIQLKLYDNQLTKIEGLETLVALKELYLYQNQIIKIEGLETLTALNQLNLSDNLLTNIEGLETLTELKELHLVNNQITKVEGLETLTALNQLNLAGNLITKIEGLETLTTLNQLNLSINQITKIEGLETLTALNQLKLYGNKLKKIEGLETLNALNQLDLAGNLLTKIEGLETLIALNQLDLAGNLITKIEGMGSLTVLNQLDLSSNAIIKIEGLETLTALNQLDLASNDIIKIEGLEKLTALLQLNLSDNLLTNIEGLDLIKNKEDFYLTLFSNPLDEKYQLKLNRNENHFPFIKSLLQREAAAVQISIKYPVKVLVLGNHASGKSSLVNTLTRLTNNGSTHILRIENYNINKNGKKKTSLPDAIFYDFGGQDFYHGLYKAFITSGGIQLILFKTESDYNQLDKDKEGYDIINFNRNYWLGQKKYSVNTDPYIMVQTYAEKDDARDAASIDYQEYPGYKKNFFLSLSDDLSVSQKEDEAFYTAGKQYFKAYFNGELRKMIAAQQYSQPQWYINFLEFIYSKPVTNHEPVEVKTLLPKYENEQDENQRLEMLCTDLITLTRHGLLLYYNSPGLKDIVWLNPQQLVKHIQEKVLNKDSILTKKGIIPKEEFEKEIVKDKRILLLLTEQKVVFLHNPTGQEKDEEYIIPNYLPLADENDPDYQLFMFGLQQPDFIIKFNDFIPFGFINQLVCFYGMQPDVKKFWRNQLLFTINNEARVLIQCDFTTLQVKVYIQLLSSAKSTKKDVSTYLFYSLLALYWDNPNDTIFTYDEYQQSPSSRNKKDDERISPIRELSKEDNNEFYGLDISSFRENAPSLPSKLLIRKYEIWENLKSHTAHVPPDAYLSVDGERFVFYKTLFEREEKTFRLPAYLLKDGRIDLNSSKEIPITPFEPFTHKKTGSMKKVFISYSHDDIAMRQTLQQYLINLERDGLIEIWQDGLIQAGEDWDKKIKQGLENADICILLLSQPFIASNYVHETEFRTIMEKRNNETCQIIPVLLKDCDWKNWKVYPPDVMKSLGEEAPEYKIGSFQFLPEENKRLKAIGKWQHPEEAWLQVADTIRAFCK